MYNFYFDRDSDYDSDSADFDSSVSVSDHLSDSDLDDLSEDGPRPCPVKGCDDSVWKSNRFCYMHKQCSVSDCWSLKDPSSLRYCKWDKHWDSRIYFTIWLFHQPEFPLPPELKYDVVGYLKVAISRNRVFVCRICNWNRYFTNNDAACKWCLNRTRCAGCNVYLNRKFYFRPEEPLYCNKGSCKSQALNPKQLAYA